MIFEELPLKEAWLITARPHKDERGYFARMYCETAFKEQGLNTRWVQVNQSFNRQSGILRGLHRQLAPHAEIKLVTCLVGTIYDVIVDLRPTSSTYKQWYGVALSENNHRLLYVPAGFAHGYQTLTENALVSYQVSDFYAPQAESGIRWNDPAFQIEWPSAPQRIISSKDAIWGDFKE
jgi:dTDP-4-dehydrorhamnose 3,5-epimerase